VWDGRRAGFRRSPGQSVDPRTEEVGGYRLVESDHDIPTGGLARMTVEQSKRDLRVQISVGPVVQQKHLL
jgi:hypothetical protein